MAQTDKRILIVDGQVFQTPAWHRGMGKYSFELLRALEKLNNKHHYWQAMHIVFSKGLQESKEDPEMRAHLKEGVKKAKLVDLDLLPNVIGDKTIVETNRTVIDAYLQEVLGQDQDLLADYVVLSLLQGELFSAFSTHDRVRNTLLYYDLIPLMFHRLYLGNPITRTEYFSKFSELLRADRYLAISQTGANDLALYLGVDKDRIQNIDGGPINHGNDKTSKVDIAKPFILMPTGNDLRKNNRRGIVGFEEFNRAHDNKYALVITSYFKEHEVVELSKLSPNVIFTGNIKGEELNYLYQNCEALLFPAEYEGLGLPILEAVEKDRPIACSNISVFREMSREDFVFFNPRSTTDITVALKNVLDPAYKPNKKNYKTLLNRYVWTRTAAMTVDALFSADHAVVHNKPRVAVFGPDPSHGRSVGYHMVSAHAELSRMVQAEYFIEAFASTDDPRVNYLPYATTVTDISRWAKIDTSEYSATVYNLSNTKHCAKTLLAALAQPGIAVLHDTVLHDAWQALCAGDQPLADKSRLELEKKLDAKYGGPDTEGIVSLVTNQKAVVVFTQAAKKRVEAIMQKANLSVPVYYLAMPSAPVVYDDILPDTTKTVGMITSSVDDAQVFAKLKTDGFRQQIIPAEVSLNLAEELEQPTDLDYMDALSALSYIADDSDGAGDNSNVPGTAQAMQFGAVPVSVGANGWSDEIPADTCLHLQGEQDLGEALAKNKKLATMRSKAQQYAIERSYKAYAAELSGIIKACTNTDQ